jgi:hypothetical protein
LVDLGALLDWGSLVDLGALLDWGSLVDLGALLDLGSLVDLGAFDDTLSFDDTERFLGRTGRDLSATTRVIRARRRAMIETVFIVCVCVLVGEKRRKMYYCEQ